MRGCLEDFKIGSRLGLSHESRLDESDVEIVSNHHKVSGLLISVVSKHGISMDFSLVLFGGQLVEGGVLVLHLASDSLELIVSLLEELMRGNEV